MIPTLTIVDIFMPILGDLQLVEDRMREASIENQHPALTSALDHLLASGGKRVRPAITLFTGRLLDAPLAPTVSLAAAIEMLHTATLVHDDLIDGSLLRRGLPTLNSEWTPAATVLTGDFLFARAAALAAQTGSVAVMNVFSRALMIIVNGELNQMFIGRGQASREGYLQRIYAKTASLFEIASEAAAILAHANAETVASMRGFGCEVGMAFQIMDDILDFTGDQARLGKPVGSDLRQGLFTLPVLCHLEQHPEDRDVAALLNGKSGDSDRVDRVDRVVRAVRASGAIDQALGEAKDYVARAQARLSTAPDNEHRQALSHLAEYFVSRSV